MQANVQNLSKKAIDAALKNNWAEAVTLNKKVLAKDPKNKKAKIRLGRAYIQTENFSEAKEIFEEILIKDPINKIAKKNLKLAEEKKPARKNGSQVVDRTKALIIEPGTTAEVRLPLDKKLIDLLEPGQELKISSAKNSLTFLTKENNKKLGKVTDLISKTVFQAREDDLKVEANIATLNENHLIILLKCKKPIFKAQKQKESPDVQKGLINEPKLELPDHADADSDSE